MTGPGIYLTRMLVFLLIVAVACGLLFGGLRDAFFANAILNGLIIGVMILGIIYIFRMVIMLRSEVTWIETFRRTEMGEPVPAPPRLLAPMASMLGERRDRMTLSAMSTRSLLDTISARLDESRDISRYLIGLLIFLGLLGTFWGLLQTVNAVGTSITGLSFGSGDFRAVFDDLKQGLEAPLSGMGTAFSSSLFGLAGSLVLGFLDLQAGQSQNRFYNDLEEWLSSVTRLSSGGPGIEGEQSIPVYVQALLGQTAESLESLQRTVARAEERQTSANNSIFALTDQLSMLTDQLRNEQRLLANLADRAGESALDEATRHHIRNLEVYLARILEELSAGRTQMVEELRNEIKLLARTIAVAAEEQERRAAVGDRR